MPDADSPPSEPSALEPLTPDQRQLYLELLQHCESLFESPELRGGTPSPATSPDSTCSDISRPDTPSRVNPRSIAPRPATPEQPLADKFPHIPGLPKLPTPMPVKAESGASSERDSFYPKEEDQKLQKIDPGANSEQVGMGVRIRSHIKLYHCCPSR
ncbi:hypothetical protein N7532_011363 [Penicillium argentinense]|uniref:Uncharacterized protein n=1 Tax=Penicillium argentinense TaxID=1131581 RepID=A0A9W9JUW3_9EURO|nr:uncharacterized protein N7532_011363 [Penicillium argentinense]KAJ5082320.1 hypothetical protein N7532_011363 [Penicillium argentinense]